MFFFLSTNLIAQDTRENMKFFDDFFPNADLEIMYSEHQFGDMDKIISLVKDANTIHKTEYNNRIGKIKIDSIILTKDEIDYVTSNIKTNNDKIWAKNAIPNLTYISRKKVDRIFNDKSKGWEYFEKKYAKTFYSFSPPIFLRNNSMCFIYIGIGCGNLCGSGSFDFYIKQDDKWIPFTSLCVWIS